MLLLRVSCSPGPTLQKNTQLLLQKIQYLIVTIIKYWWTNTSLFHHSYFCLGKTKPQKASLGICMTLLCGLAHSFGLPLRTLSVKQAN